jgi:hypothetical protein
MMVLLPLLVYMALWILLLQWTPDGDWRKASLRAGVLFGVTLVLVIEGLSLFRLVTPIALGWAWGLSLVGVLAVLLFVVQRRGAFRPPAVHVRQGWGERGMLALILCILIVKAYIAWVSPPNTWDSLNYHMPRVAHWAQQKAVRHYITGIEVQNSMPPGSEMAILNFYVLLGGDRLSNFVSWFAMLGSVIGVSYIARQLGASSTGQIFAGLFAATLPMGIAQASSTMSDYVVAYWMVAVFSETLTFFRNANRFSPVLYASTAAGLGLLAKPTAAAYFLPFVVVFAIISIRQQSFGTVLRNTAVAAAMVLLMNAGHWSRNLSLYGNPIANPERIAIHATTLTDFRLFLSNVLRNAGIHLGTPSPHVNKAIYLTIQKIHQLIDVPLDDPRITLGGYFKVPLPSTSESKAPNPAQAYLYLFVFVALLARYKKVPAVVRISFFSVSAGFLIYSAFFQWQIFATRLHLAFFVLTAGVVGSSLENMVRRRFVDVIGVLLFIACLPWLLSLRERPILTNEKTYRSSVLGTSRLELYYVSGGHLIKPHQDVMDRIRDSTCDAVGIILPGNDAEYPLWVLAGSPRSDIHIEWVVNGGPSVSLADPTFTPCAVIYRRSAADTDTFFNLPRAYDHRPTKLSLFMETR